MTNELVVTDAAAVALTEYVENSFSFSGIVWYSVVIKSFEKFRLVQATWIVIVNNSEWFA